MSSFEPLAAGPSLPEPVSAHSPTLPGASRAAEPGFPESRSVVRPQPPRPRDAPAQGRVPDARAEEPRPLQPEELARLLSENLPLLRSLVRRWADPRLLRRESHSDLVQSTCRELLAASSTLTYLGEAAFRSLLAKTAERKLIDKQRYHGRKKRAASAEVVIEADELQDEKRDASSPSVLAERTEELTLLSEAMDRLSEEQRGLILARHLLGVPTANLAEELHISPGAVRARLSRAIARLSTAMTAA